ncbi:MAG: hypothetical protein BWY65_00498 [Firmicutes bacterium ADurb.Bin373]|nr:MAG: hypothetical protein BWY65_00498 [Firmicutes bacterium ADurb.Bin373]
MASAVSGPVASITMSSSGISLTSRRTISTSGWPASFSVTLLAKRVRSTARAPPAGTFVSSAQLMISEPKRLISSLSKPTAFSKAVDRKELLQTNSAKSPLRCAGVGFLGRISNSLTLTPLFTACQAASDPARPAPTMVIAGGCLLPKRLFAGFSIEHLILSGPFFILCPCFTYQVQIHICFCLFR